MQTRDDFKSARLIGKDGKIKPAKDPLGPNGHAPGFGLGRPDLAMHGTR